MTGDANSKPAWECYPPIAQVHRSVNLALLYLLAIVARRDLKEAPEDQAEIALVGETHVLSNPRYRKVSGSQQGLSFCDSEAIEVGVERLTGCFFEASHEVRLAHADNVGSAGKSNGFRIVNVDVIKEWAESLQGALPAFECTGCCKLSLIVIDQQDQNHFKICASNQS